MKAGKFIFLSICCLATMICKAQVFPESDAIWNIKIDTKEHYYGLTGDTIIDGKSYSKLYLLNDTTLIPDSRKEYLGGFRQEGKKVWFRPSLHDDYISNYPYYPKETVLHDFSNVGDTIWHNFVSDWNVRYWEMRDSISASIITSKFTDEQGRTIYNTQQFIIINSNRKEFTYEVGRDRWIEGIGSIGKGLFWFIRDKIVGGKLMKYIWPVSSREMK